MKNDNLTKSQALPKIRKFCAYQERCHQEVKDKLYSYGLYGEEIDAVISTLIEENYLNEQRFAEQFSGGRFRMKHWGRVKIKYELKQKHVSEFCIKKGLLVIDDEEYDKVLQKEAKLKWRTLSGEQNIFIKRRKLLNYLLQKGFESDLSREIMKQLEQEN